ncbi:type II toxin-antitoxin system prevent-host-death family antitoxin [Kingella oralis]|uniref:type II toxin-antitoxin system prevent-host-death family antitoxin n=1 Tax=Kingella oralis TaxID=505 RepID=UPI0034E40D08
MQTISSREFNQNVAKAKNMSDTAPVCITDRGKPAYVLMNYAAYQSLNKHPKSNAERLGMSVEDLELVGEVEFPRCIIADREELF